MPDLTLPSARELLAELVALPGPPGAEGAIRDRVAALVRDVLGCPCHVDAKGNLLTAPAPGGALPERPAVLVAAHLDEIALMVARVEGDGTLAVSALGGVQPWKWGEGPVEVLAANGVYVPGVLSFGSIHTTSAASAIQQTRDGRPLTWNMANVLTGLSADVLQAAGVRPGSRVVVARDRRRLWDLGGDLVSSYFLDDRADLVAWLLTLRDLAASTDGAYKNVLFAATTSEEVGGEGALFLLRSLPAPPAVCVALEIGPRTPDADFPIDAAPTCWVADSYAASEPRDLDLVAASAKEAGTGVHFQAVTRGGSDASCAASHGLIARPITLAFPAENSHGFEIMHRDAPESLARLTTILVRRLTTAS